MTARTPSTGARLPAALGAALVAVAVLVAGCTGSAGSSPSAPSPMSPSPSSPLPPSTTVTSTVGTSTVTFTRTTVTGTVTVSGSVTTVTAGGTGGSGAAGSASPPPATKEPAPVAGTCPYLSNEAVMDANGQHTGQTTVIGTKPYPVCVFTRSDGGYLATTRIVVAGTAAQAAAAVNQLVPPATSNPAAFPAGWSGGAMGHLNGVPGYPLARSVYAVSKGKVAIIAISNQAQSIKGRQMVEQIVANLHL